jgi:hypothetical protein
MFLYSYPSSFFVLFSFFGFFFLNFQNFRNSKNPICAEFEGEENTEESNVWEKQKETEVEEKKKEGGKKKNGKGEGDGENATYSHSRTSLPVKAGLFLGIGDVSVISFGSSSSDLDV